MINYVNNAFDKVLKPCDAQQFMTLTQSGLTEKLITLHRAGDTRAKPKLPAITYMGVIDAEKYKAYYTQCAEKGQKPLGSRRAEFMRPTGLFMLDLDHVGDARALYDKIIAACFPAFESWLALAHITPSGDGLRLVLRRTKGKTIEQEQYEFCRAMDFDAVGVTCDTVCKDISRLSFAPMQKEILYFNPELLFAPLPDAADYPDEGAPLFSPQGGMTGSRPQDTAMSGASPLGGTEGGSFPTTYEGMEYAAIVARLEEQLGGRPERGARNSFIFTMACNLRYICNDDPDWVASILPTYGEEPQKHRMTIQSAINRPMSREMPETLKRALRITSLESSSLGGTVGGSLGEEGAPLLPAVLPEPVRLLVSHTPGKMRPAVAMAVFPPLAAHLCGTEFVYADNRSYEATFMTLLMAELSSGKSAVNQPIEYIIADMRARDEVARGREREWREACSTTPDSKEKPKRPEGLGIQVLTPDMTNAAFVQRLADAKGRFLYTVMDEVELLDALKTGGRVGSVSQILRLAFDCGMYGQERVGGSSVNEQVKVRWNWNASTTIQRGRNYFRNSLTDGTLSRLSLATIVRDEFDWGREIPKYGTYGQAFADALQPYIDSLNVCRGVIRSPEAILWAEAMIDEQVSFAESCDDRAYAQLSFRAVLMGFLRGMVLYVMNGMQWTDEIAEFAAWSVRYDMWCKMHFFGDLLHQGLEAEAAAVQRNCTRNLLDLLPATFSRQMAQDMRMAQGRRPNPSGMLRQWMHRGFIGRGENEMYYKLPK